MHTACMPIQQTAPQGSLDLAQPISLRPLLACIFVQFLRSGTPCGIPSLVLIGRRPHGAAATGRSLAAYGEVCFYLCDYACLLAAFDSIGTKSGRARPCSNTGRNELKMGEEREAEFDKVEGAARRANRRGLECVFFPTSLFSSATLNIIQESSYR